MRTNACDTRPEYQDERTALQRSIYLKSRSRGRNHQKSPNTHARMIQATTIQTQTPITSPRFHCIRFSPAIDIVLADLSQVRRSPGSPCKLIDAEAQV